ncbi:hypothetical protein EMIT079MI2_530005 [Bacillus sp. IT-79MI2]
MVENILMYKRVKKLEGLLYGRILVDLVIGMIIGLAIGIIIGGSRKKTE